MEEAALSVPHLSQQFHCQCCSVWWREVICLCNIFVYSVLKGKIKEWNDCICLVIMSLYLQHAEKAHDAVEFSILIGLTVLIRFS